MKLIAALMVFLAAASAQGNIWGFKKGAMRFGMEGSYFTTNQNYDSTGTTAILPGDNSFTEIRTVLGGSYDFNDWVGANLDLSFKRNTSVDPSLERTNTNFSELRFGAQALLLDSKVKLVPDLKFTLPLHGKITDSAYLDDQAFKIEGRLYASMMIKRWIGLAAYSGFEFKGDGLSSSIPYGGWVHTQFSKFYVDLGLMGYASMKNDQYTDNASFREDVNANLNGSSYLYQAVNPSLTYLSFWGGWMFSKGWTLGLGAEIPLMGTNTAKGNRFLANLTFEIGGRKKRRYRRNSFRARPTETEDELERPRKKKKKKKRRRRRRRSNDY